MQQAGLPASVVAVSPVLAVRAVGDPVAAVDTERRRSAAQRARRERQLDLVAEATRPQHPAPGSCPASGLQVTLSSTSPTSMPLVPQRDRGGRSGAGLAPTASSGASE